MGAEAKYDKPDMSMFQFLTGSRFHFYADDFKDVKPLPGQRFNSLQEVGFISTSIDDVRRIVGGIGFNSLQEVGFISTRLGRKHCPRSSVQFQFLTGSRFHFYRSTPSMVTSTEIAVSIPYRK